MRKLVTVIVLIALGAVVQIVLHAATQAPEAPGAGNGFLIDKHLAAKLECASCHTEKPPSRHPETKVICLGCHGPTYNDLAKQTIQKIPNPHASHRGELACGNCHHVHKASELLCDNCHRGRKFDLKTP
jgi:fumarate reductase flavoprotein subunit